jgi:hypothetical protein
MTVDAIIKCSGGGEGDILSGLDAHLPFQGSFYLFLSQPRGIHRDRFLASQSLGLVLEEYCLSRRKFTSLLHPSELPLSPEVPHNVVIWALHSSKPEWICVRAPKEISSKPCCAGYAGGAKFLFSSTYIWKVVSWGFAVLSHAISALNPCSLKKSNVSAIPLPA